MPIESIPNQTILLFQLPVVIAIVLAACSLVAVALLAVALFLSTRDRRAHSRAVPVPRSNALMGDEPLGHCPSCDKIVPVMSSRCRYCKAVFRFR